jgi:hypothetical protein
VGRSQYLLVIFPHGWSPDAEQHGKASRVMDIRFGQQIQLGADASEDSTAGLSTGKYLSGTCWSFNVKNERN